MDINWNIVFSIITAMVAIFALIQTQLQIRLSNKQHLFDKRIENYMIADGLIQLYKQHYKNINVADNKDEPAFANDMMFAYLTNNAYLEKITDVIGKPLENPNHKQFLIKMECLNDVATKIKFLFPNKPANLLGDFVIKYKELLFAMYQYQILLGHLNKTSEQFHLTLEDSQRAVGEQNHRANLEHAINNLKEIYLKIEKNKVIEQIEKQIKL